MAFKLPSFKIFSGTDTKGRVFLIFGALVVVSVLIFFAVRILGGGPKAVGPSRVAAAPRNLQSTPGGQIQGQYYQALMELNAQKSQQAQISGGSAVPTLVNLQQQGESSSNCTVLCPGDAAANVADDINDLVRTGKLSQKDADNLLDLAKRNVSVDEYAAALDQLVKEGKLTPEQARALLEKYKKQHQNALVNDSAATMDALIKSGQLPLDAATQLLALQKANVSPADYTAELNRLVRDGKISPATAAALSAQYARQKAQEATKASIFGLKQLAKAGAITQGVADDLAAMQARNASVDDYAAELQRLVAAGKMTPEEAARLLAQYKQQHQGGAAALEALIQQYQAQCQKDLQEQAKSKTAGGTPSPLPASCQKLQQLQAELKKLQEMQGNNASAADYADELKRAVAAGLITPDMAAQLMQAYQSALLAAAGPTTVPGVETNLPNAADFAAIQAHIQQHAPAAVAPPTEEFAQAAAQAGSQAEQDRLQRIQQLQTAMSAQAQTLLTAWQPPKMSHVSGSAESPNKKGAAGSGAAGSSETTSTTTVTTSSTGAPLIKAGTILFGVLDTAVDSDYPDTPVMVTIVSGPFKDAKLLGKLSLAQSMDKVSLNFTMMNRDDWPKTKNITAFAIDPDTARTVLASSANYHYMMRYGSLFASSFLTGYASAIQGAGSTTTTGVFGTTATSPPLSPGNKIAVGLGAVGTQFTNAIQGYVNTPTTVKVNAGVGLGILFMADVPA